MGKKNEPTDDETCKRYNKLLTTARSLNGITNKPTDDETCKWYNKQADGR